MQILCPHPWIKIHILHDNTLTAENRDKLNYLVGRYGQQIKFYNVEQLLPEKISALKKYFSEIENTRFTIGTLFRLLIPDLFPAEIEKIIYLDADTIVNLDIAEFWQINLKEKILASVPECVNDIFFQQRIPSHYLETENLVVPEDYFCAGVLMIDLQKFRAAKEKFESGIKFIATVPTSWIDQDILNYCFSKDYLKVDEKFQTIIESERIKNPNTVGKKIYHYTLDTLELNLNDAFNRLWFKYFCKTPWFNENIFGNIFESVRQIYNDGKNLTIQMTKIMSGKERGFFIDVSNIEAVKNIFAVAEDEEIISAESVENLIQSMQKSHGKKIFFIFAGNFPEVYQKLSAAGFVFGRDFFNIFDLLSESHGVYFNTHSIIKNL